MPENKTFDGLCNDARTALQGFYPTLKALVVAANEATPAANADGDTVDETQSEMAANVVLAIRHLEDCSMRLGKAIQAFNGGVSPLKSTLGAPVAAAAGVATAPATAPADKTTPPANEDDSSADGNAGANTSAADSGSDAGGDSGGDGGGE